MTHNVSRVALIWVGLLVAMASPLAAQRNFDDVEIRAEKLADGVHVLFGAGGNIGVSSGPDGVFLVDDQFAPLTDKIRAKIASLGGGAVRFVVNTHWHSDHTGGNENLGKAGAVIVAHDAVRRRMSVEHFMAEFDSTTPASPPAALPVVTFGDDVTFHLNGDEIHVFHVAPAHTDGDSFVHFRGADVLHVGDIWFNGSYPFVDLSSGGSLDGVLAAIDRALAVAGPQTRIIPGHGPVGGREALTAYAAMLRDARGRVAQRIAAGASLDDVLAAKLTADLDEKWGAGFIGPEAFVRMVYRSLTAAR
jgi:glyoxylase-like metal-dependent hydrolase (beta-lactamase superfamily II)